MPADTGTVRSADRPGPCPVPPAVLRSLDLAVIRRVESLIPGEHLKQQVGGGTLKVGGANTFSGNVWVTNSSTLQLGSSAALPTGPEIDLPPVSDIKERLPFGLTEGERWIGFALAGVPHLVVRVDDVERVDVVGRGRPLRYDSSLAQGANVNFVSPDGSGGWRIRTYERGVEGETLACGTGAVATAIMLHVNGDAGLETGLLTRSGRTLRVRLEERTLSGWHPTLSGEARIVFQGVLGEV